jgi:outer membrane receptor protein involved in Fe transport
LNKIPEFTVQGYPTVSGNGLPYNIDARSWEVRDNLTKSLGAHTVKFGMLFINSFKAENTRVRDGGTLSFETAAQVSNFRAQDSGHAIANLLLGAFTRYSETSDTSNAPARYNQWEFYVNDQWRIHPRLSLTLGLRYQYIPWPHTDLNNIIGFDPARFDAEKAPLAANISSAGIINLIADPTGQKTRTQGFYDPYNGLVIAGCDFPAGSGR